MSAAGVPAVLVALAVLLLATVSMVAVTTAVLTTWVPGVSELLEVTTTVGPGALPPATIVALIVHETTAPAAAPADGKVHVPFTGAVARANVVPAGTASVLVAAPDDGVSLGPLLNAVIE